jgi:hypothetical protein
VKEASSLHTCPPPFQTNSSDTFREALY